MARSRLPLSVLASGVPERVPAPEGYVVDHVPAPGTIVLVFVFLAAFVAGITIATVRPHGPSLRASVAATATVTVFGEPLPAHDLLVDASGAGGAYTTVQAAVDAAVRAAYGMTLDAFETRWRSSTTATPTSA